MFSWQKYLEMKQKSDNIRKGEIDVIVASKFNDLANILAFFIEKHLIVTDKNCAYIVQRLFI